jgi:hypothetical protein
MFYLSDICLLSNYIGGHGKLSRQEPQLTREEVEKRLESRQIVFGIEKAPMMLPMEIFSHDNSNQDR